MKILKSKSPKILIVEEIEKTKEHNIAGHLIKSHTPIAEIVDRINKVLSN